ncbi:MAG: PhoU domain-containing protein [Campylobacterota bacterium]|nr:PhoU domain-containing protein [Campylobacterota bacterium]
MLTGYQEARHEVRKTVIEVVTNLSIANKLALQALESIDVNGLEEARKSLKMISATTEKIDNDIVLIFAKYTPEARDLREMVSYLKVTSELNRIRTNINNYIKNMQSVIVSSNPEVNKVIRESLNINRCTLTAFDATLEMLQTFDDKDKIQSLTTKIEVEYSKTDDIYTLLEKELIQKMGNSHTVAEEYFNLLKYIRKNLKVIDRLESISSRIIFARLGGKL